MIFMRKYAGKDDVIPLNFWDNYEHTKKLGTFSSSSTLPIDSVNYNILKQIVKDRPITSPSTFEQKLQAHTRRMKELWVDPNSTYNSPEFRRKRKTVMNTPEFKENMSKIATTRWNDPEYQAKMKLKRGKPEYRKKMSKSLRQYYAWKKVGAAFQMLFLHASEE